MFMKIKKINTNDAKKIISNISCATCVDSDRNIGILKKEDENKIVSNIIEYKNKYIEKVIEVEKANKKVEETNIENEKLRKEKEQSDRDKNEVLKENEKLIKEKEEYKKSKKLTEIRLEIEKDHNKKREYIKTKRRNIKIKKIACVILISALISTLEFIIFKNIDTIKIFMEKYFVNIMEFNIDLFKYISIVIGIFFIVAFTININNSKNIVKKNTKKFDILQNKSNNYCNNRDVNNSQGNNIYHNCNINNYNNSSDNDRKENKDKKQ